MAAKNRPGRTAKEKIVSPDKKAVSSEVEQPRMQERKETAPMKAISYTLLELIQNVNAFTENDREVAVMVAHLVNSGRVRLRGNFAGMKIKLSPSRSTHTSAS